MAKNESKLAATVSAKATQLNSAMLKAAEAGLRVQALITDEQIVALDSYKNSCPRLNVRVYGPPPKKGESDSQ